MQKFPCYTVLHSSMFGGVYCYNQNYKRRDLILPLTRIQNQFVSVLYPVCSAKKRLSACIIKTIFAKKLHSASLSTSADCGLWYAPLRLVYNAPMVTQQFKHVFSEKWHHNLSYLVVMNFYPLSCW